MFLHGVRIDQDIVDIDNHESVEHISEDVVDECLEDGGTVDEPERHNKVFVVPSSCGEGSFPFIPLPNSDQICYALRRSSFV